MIKPGSLVRLEPKYYSITHSIKPFADLIGIVIKTEPDFYRPSLVPNKGVDRHYILWGNEIYSYEPTNALIEVLLDDV
jgi:hypothetical protein